MTLRKPTQAELNLIRYLVDKAALARISSEWPQTLLVSSMTDGNMGSLLLFPDGKVTNNRNFGQCVSEYQFIDVDNINALASLNIDQNEQLFELDIWKTNFTPLVSLPVSYS